MTQTPFLSCIVDAVGQGEIDADTAAEARGLYEEAHAAVDAALGPVEADRQASRVVMSALEKKAVRQRQLTALSVRSRRSVLEGIAELKRQRGYESVEALGGKGGKPPKDGWVQGGTPPGSGPGKSGAVAARALELLVENRPGLSGAPFASIDGRHRSVLGQMHAMMADLIEAFETKTGFDAPGRAHLDNVVREAFGQDTGDQAAKALAEAWGETAEYGRQLFNAAGGEIGKLEKWGLPQSHDPLEVRKVGRGGWVEAILPRLDRAKMTDAITGQAFTEKRLRAVLGDVWDTIATDGWAKRQPGELAGKGRLADQRADSRFLVFKDADNWLAYAKEFGAGDPFGTMMHHLEGMSRDIAQMQILGPNPQAQFEWLSSFAEREAAMELKAGIKGAERGKTYVRQARNMYDHFTGVANTPERQWLADMGATTRSYLTGSMLGSAILTDIPTAPVFGAIARSFSGQSVVGDLAAPMKLLLSPEARGQARRMGFINEQAMDGLIHGSQDSLRLMTVGGKVDGRGLNAFARRLPAASFRLQGLTAYTAMRKRSFRLQMMGALADRQGMTLAAMAAGDAEDKAMAGLLKARGFTEADWAQIGKAEKWAPADGASFLRPREIIEAAGQDLGLRVAEMVELETRFAVPETSLWTRAKLLQQSRPGTFQGEFNRSWAMFRSFSLTATQLYGEELLHRALLTAHPAAMMSAWAAGLLAALTVGGGVAVQLKQVVQGKDPRDMTDAKFWAAAATQGGGMGIIGDFAYSAESRAGKSSAMTGWGPTAGFASDAMDLTVGNATQIFNEASKPDVDLGEAVEKARIGRDATKFAARYAPLSSLWWARTAWDRMVVDQLQKLVDPDADEAFRNQMRKTQRDYGQDYYWPEGQSLPDRGPDMAAALGAN